MTRHDSFEADLFSVFDADAQVPIPDGGLERLHAAIADRRPRPARLAGLGGRWVADPSAASSPLRALRATVPVLRLSAAVLLLLLALALIGTAALLGGRLMQTQPELERLLYGLDGDIYLADPAGADPTRVAEGAALFEGSPWAPDGRHFLSFDSTRLAADIREPDGQVVASFANLPGFSGFPAWSPDSTRLQAWTQSYRQINIYGIDGGLQAELPLPEGYTRFRDNLGVWAPDGRSVWVLIAGSNGNGEREAWALPIDGSAPQRVAEGSPFITFPPNFTRDGTRMAFWGGNGYQPKLFVSNADGTDLRPLGEGVLPIWSPNGEQLAYFVAGGDENTIDLKVVDITTGTDRTLVAGWQYSAWPPYSWSPAGDRILFSKQSGLQTQEGPATGSLWTVGAEGGEPTLLVEGATQGEWQPTPSTSAATPSAAPTPTAAQTSTPRPKADYAVTMVAALDELQRARDGNEDITYLLDHEVAWLSDRLPATWKDDPAIAAYIDAVYVLARVSPTTPAWDRAWAAYFATRPALAALAPGLTPTPTPGASPPLQVPPSEACALTVKWIHVYDDMGSNSVETVLDPPPLRAPYRVSMDQEILGRPAAQVIVDGDRWPSIVSAVMTAPDGTQDSYGLDTPAGGWHKVFYEVGTYVVELSSTQNECKATLVFEVLPGPIPTPAP